MKTARQTAALRVRRATIASHSTTSTRLIASVILAISAHLTRATVRHATCAQRARRVRRAPPFSLTTNFFPKKSRQTAPMLKATKLRRKIRHSCKSFPTKSKSGRKKKPAEHTTVNLAMLLQLPPQMRVRVQQCTREKWALPNDAPNACSPMRQTHAKAAIVQPTQQIRKALASWAGSQVQQVA